MYAFRPFRDKILVERNSSGVLKNIVHHIQSQTFHEMICIHLKSNLYDDVLPGFECKQSLWEPGIYYKKMLQNPVAIELILDKILLLIHLEESCLISCIRSERDCTGLIPKI